MLVQIAAGPPVQVDDFPDCKRSAPGAVYVRRGVRHLTQEEIDHIKGAHPDVGRRLTVLDDKPKIKRKAKGAEKRSARAMKPFHEHPEPVVVKAPERAHHAPLLVEEAAETAADPAASEAAEQESSRADDERRRRPKRRN